MAAGEALLPCLPSKCSSFSMKSPDISSWKNPSACVMEKKPRHLLGLGLNEGTVDEASLEMLFFFLFRMVLFTERLKLFPSRGFTGEDTEERATTACSKLRVAYLSFFTGHSVMVHSCIIRKFRVWRQISRFLLFVLWRRFISAFWFSFMVLSWFLSPLFLLPSHVATFSSSLTQSQPQERKRNLSIDI